jgi:LPS export ABC transporter protein LptC
MNLMSFCVRSLSIFILIIALAILFAGCNDEDTEYKIKLDNIVSDQRVEDFILTETMDGELVWKLEADYADMYEDKDIARINGVEVKFYKDGEVSSHLTSDWGTVDLKSNNMVAYERVIVVTDDGDILRTSKLRWDASDKMIRSEEKVKLIRKKSIIYGIGFETDPELNSFKTTKMVGYLTEEEVSEYSGEEEELD